MFLLPVHTPDTEKEWLNLPLKWYRKFSQKPFMLVDDTSRVFDPGRNTLLREGKVKRWLIYDHYNLCAGRIAAYYQPGDPVGRIGFFETLQNKDIAFGLFDAATRWLHQQGCTSVEGPVNFGEKDRFWGLLTKGFESKGLYLDNFNPTWYEEFFLEYGYRKKDRIYTYHLALPNVPAVRLQQVAEWSGQKYELHYEAFSWSRLDFFLPQIHAIYTSSFRSNNRIAHLRMEDIRHLLQEAKPFLKENFFLLAYCKEQPAGFLIFLKEPGVQVFQRQVQTLKGFAFATVPEVRGKGVEAGLAWMLYQQLQKEGDKYNLMLSGINASTIKMNTLIKKLGGDITRVHQTYTFEINDYE